MKQLPRTLRRSGRLGRYALLLSLAIHSVASGATSDPKNASSLVADVVKQTGRTGGLVVLLDNGDTVLANAFLKRPQILLQTLASTEARYLAGIQGWMVASFWHASTSTPERRLHRPRSIR